MAKQNKNKPRLNKYERNKKYKQKLRRIADETSNYVGGGAVRIGYDDKYSWYDGNHICLDDECTKYIKRVYISEWSSKYHKRLSNRRVRRYKGYIPSGCWYQKLYDYWWEMF